MNSVRSLAHDLNVLKNVHIQTVDRSTLVDIRDVVLKTELPKDECMLDYACQIHNPYCYRCGTLTVKIGYSGTKVTLDDQIENHFRTM